MNLGIFRGTVIRGIGNHSGQYPLTIDVAEAEMKLPAARKVDVVE